MPRANITAAAAWRAELLAEQSARAATREAWMQRWATFICIAAVLYMLIGHNPYQHDVQLSEDTGGAALSPVNRYVWMLTAVFSAPLLWARRTVLRQTLAAYGLLLAVYVWFAATTLWALDPQTADRRLLFYISNLVIALAVALTFQSTRRLHRALAIACAILIVIDLLSWVLMPRLSMTDLGLAAIHTQKNQLGAAMLFSCLVIGPYCFLQQTRRRRLAWMGVLLAGLVMLAASRSKTSIGIELGGLLVAPALLALAKLPKNIVRGFIGAVLLVVLVSLYAWTAWCAARDVSPLGPLQNVTFTQRTDVWAFVFSEIIKRPWTGTGFGSFWDVNPLIQPSLQGDYWFGSPSIANEAHNGYLDLLVTTGVIGFVGALALLFRWISRSLGLLRDALLPEPSAGEAAWPSDLVLALFPLLLLTHNFMESTYFTANQIFGSLAIIIGVEIDRRAAARRSSRRAAPAQPAPQKQSHYHAF